MSKKLTHIDQNGQVTMVDVGHKPETMRKAIVESFVRVSPETMALLKDNALPKGDVLTTAKIAGIMAAKKTAELIPLCHPLFLSYVDVRFEIDDQESLIRVEAEARTTASTGVEMEALVAAQVACMTIYDMCKAVQKDIVIERCQLVHKSGGRSGTYDKE
ncbi:cyclic pyranopterin monophosphate synthase MoaC [Desulfohalobiaceae bacterium Ax17]|uniref:cyclic pyranopterin monophosphate synthase MoaC n=1 Tax=Desulfovulcanus ferrireducens TaxID=2831190 RepID=UPI00207B99D1|nr:cyclic pyranopterin monophosphate synthase MoaC [Desulfovulcanus ferrireducens]MBT8763832.1 cyclic pyranopterin monophosphate synthase MoaC [Desulfovulcanus ferrireducens]